MFNFKEDKYILINKDSRTSKIQYADSIVTNHTWRYLEKIPTKNDAEETIKNFEKLIVEVINNFFTK
jgi:hypothetical protein